MFRRLDITLMSNPSCIKAVEDLSVDDFQYYDKDGFELNKAEQKFYRAEGHPVEYFILNHTCWQEPWFQLEEGKHNLMLDHSMFLCRCDYSGEAREQLIKLKSTIPTADYLLKTRVKWGYDFALDAVQDGTVFEVLHVEYDNTDFESFGNHMIQFDWQVRHTDWQDAANRIWQHRSEWQHLKGFEQNNWKAQFLLNWKKAEYTEKSV